MDNKLKKIIAREGLVFVGFLVGAFLVASILQFIGQGGEGWSFLLYPLYLLIRFITWAIKTLKQK